MARIKNDYFNARLSNLEIEKNESNEELFNHAENEDIIDKWAEDAIAFRDDVADPIQLYKDEYDFIFEGAQGLSLDQSNEKYFPNLTRSKTGIHNVLKLCNDYNIEKLEATYVHRIYSTRHGAGSFPGEIEYLPYSRVKDDTNVPNMYQGELRFGYPVLKNIKDEIYNDLKWFNADLKRFNGFNVGLLNTTLAVTCLDQIDSFGGGYARYIDENGFLNCIDPESLAEKMLITFGLEKLITTCGPTRENTKIVEKYYDPMKEKIYCAGN